MSPDDGPVRVALAPDAPVVLAGLRAMFSSENVRLVDVPDAADVDDDLVDIVLYDPAVGLPDGLRFRQSRLRPKLVAFSWSVRNDQAEQARREGAVVLLSKDLPLHRILLSLTAVHEGRPIEFVVSSHDDKPDESEFRPAGLTPRELEVLDMICRGHSNQEIAETLYLSINSVKTYIRSAYRRIGVTRRSQAVLWGVQSGIAG